MDVQLPIFDDAFVANSTKLDAKIESTELKVLLVKRKGKRIATSKTINIISKDFRNLNATDKKAKIYKLKVLQRELCDIDDKVIDLGVSCKAYSISDVDDICQINDKYQDKVVDTISILESTLDQPPAAPSTSEHSRNSDIRTQSRLPSIQIPHFSGEHTDFNDFTISFENAVSNRSLTDFDKFLYLKDAVRGDARVLIERIPYSNDSYSEALKILNDAFSNEYERKVATLNKLMGLKLNNNGKNYEWFSLANSLTKQVADLGIDMEFILQYFLWRSLDDRFKNTFTSVTAISEPTATQIMDNFLKIDSRCTRETNNYKNTFSYKNNKYQSSIENKIGALAMDVNVTQLSKMCKLCSSLPQADEVKFHTMSYCNRYNTVAKKLNKIRELRGCINCAGFNHLSADCRTKIKYKCKNCGSNTHLSFLCPRGDFPKETNTNEGTPTLRSFNTFNNRSKLSTNRKKQNKTEIESGVAWASMMNINSGHGVIIPSFSLTCEATGTDRSTSISGIIDTGSQYSFIDRAAMDKLKYTVIKPQVELVLRGVNETKTYKTSELIIGAEINNIMVPINVLVIPTIKTDLDVPGFKDVLMSFKEKGYRLAHSNEKCLPDCVNMILGMSSINCLKMETITYGDLNAPETMASYFKTNLGVIPVGSIDYLINNMHYLPKLANDRYLDLTLSNTDYPDFKAKSDVAHSGLRALSRSSSDCSPSTMDCFHSRAILNEKGDIISSQLELAVKDAEKFYERITIDVESGESDDDMGSQNEALFAYVIDNIKQDPATRKFVVPLLWSPTAYKLPKNYNLSYKILQTSIKKLRQTPNRLKMYNDVFQKQLEMGMIEKISNAEDFISNNNDISFLGHMPVFKDKASSPCRVVFLSNVGEGGYCHNKCLLAGYNLNETIVKVIGSLRQGKYLCITDISKAFSNLLIDKKDQNKLLFLWYEDALDSCKKIIIYRPLALPFGIPCSPNLLMCCLYKLLIYDTEFDDEMLCDLKKQIWHNTYMDNLGFSSETENLITENFKLATSTFQSVGLNLQQFATNSKKLQKIISENKLYVSEEADKTGVTGILGILWNTNNDKLSIKPYKINPSINTKRGILSELHRVFDPIGLMIPILNKGRLFLNEVMRKKHLGWDDTVGDDLLIKWRNICKSINSTSPKSIPRYIGEISEECDIIVFTDASRFLLGTVAYLKNLKSGRINFLQANNKIISPTLNKKSIAVLEAVAVHMGTKILIKLFKQFTSGVCKTKIKNLVLMTDSSICLSWLNLLNYKNDDLRKKGTLLRNRFQHITELCKIKPIHFQHIGGTENPSDLTTRCISYKKLEKSNYYSGPAELEKDVYIDKHTGILVPNPLIAKELDVFITDKVDSSHNGDECLISLNHFSSFNKTVNVIKRVMMACEMFKQKMVGKCPSKTINVIPCNGKINYYAEAWKYILRHAQKKNFSTVLDYFRNRATPRSRIPPIVSRLNLFVDSDNLLRVKTKLNKLNYDLNSRCPIILGPNCPITVSIISDMHYSTNHQGLHSLILHLRRQFWIVRFLSQIKKVIRKCAICAKFNGRPIQLNQNDYREVRLQPCYNVPPFSNVSVDFMGPFLVYLSSVKTKVYLLLISDLFTRAVNLIICRDLSVESFLRALQIHSYQFTTPFYILSDAGSQLTASKTILENFFNDPMIKNYFNERGIEGFTHEIVPSKASFLNALSENMVKQCKHLIYKSIGKLVLDYFDFELLIHNTIYLINSRPIGLKDAIHTDPNSEVITPNILLKGFDPMVLNTIPKLQCFTDGDNSKLWTTNNELVDHVHKLKRAKAKLFDIYYKEFLSGLEKNASNSNSRYLPRNYTALKVGDLVAIVLPNCKRANFPLAVIENVTINSIGEVTSANLRKSNRERVSHHVSSLIPILGANGGISNDDTTVNNDSINLIKQPLRPPRRKAAVACDRALRKLQSDDLV